MEVKLSSILEGTHVPVDHILNHNHNVKEEFLTPPVTKRNVCYICCAVIFDDSGRILLVQEAKKSCYGQWYLPAGRLESGETIIDGTKRELMEEAGVECELTTLLCAELSGIWMRFTFIGSVTGGKLKTLDQKDEESLQAKFFHVEELPTDIRSTKLRQDQNSSTSDGGSCVLRSKDILKLIDLGRKFREKRTHKDCLPVIYPHKYIVYRFVIVDRHDKRSMKVLGCKKGDNLTIPAILRDVRQSFSIPAMIASLLNEAFSMKPADCSFQQCGLLGIEHRGTGEEEDGICITYLINMDLAEDRTTPNVTAPAHFAWHSIKSSDLIQNLMEGCERKIVPVL